MSTAAAPSQRANPDGRPDATSASTSASAGANGGPAASLAKSRRSSGAVEGGRGGLDALAAFLDSSFGIRPSSEQLSCLADCCALMRTLHRAQFPVLPTSFRTCSCLVYWWKAGVDICKLWSSFYMCPSANVTVERIEAVAASLVPSRPPSLSPNSAHPRDRALLEAHDPDATSALLALSQQGTPSMKPRLSLRNPSTSNKDRYQPYPKYEIPTGARRSASPQHSRVGTPHAGMGLEAEFGGPDEVPRFETLSSDRSRRDSTAKPLWRWTSSTLPPAGYVDPSTDIPVPELSALTSLLSSLDRRGYSLQPFLQGRWVAENIEHWRLAPRELRNEDWIPPASAGNKRNPVMLTTGTTTSQRHAPVSQPVATSTLDTPTWNQPSPRQPNAARPYQSPPETVDGLHSSYLTSPVGPAMTVGAGSVILAQNTSHQEGHRSQNSRSSSLNSPRPPRPSRVHRFVPGEFADGGSVNMDAPTPRPGLPYPPSGIFHSARENSPNASYPQQRGAPVLPALRPSEKSILLSAPSKYGNDPPPTLPPVNSVQEPRPWR
ncbi:hypothetical protein DFJ73DRAFT_827529 [Zopfochytrium polystomum]|nr:hypothetical protein DFJ73DRAFT_827529 [Zopfochytrium polystomum]